jgi:hypothetical protein
MPSAGEEVVLLAEVPHPISVVMLSKRDTTINTDRNQKPKCLFINNLPPRM